MIIFKYAPDAIYPSWFGHIVFCIGKYLVDLCSAYNLDKLLNNLYKKSFTERAI